MSSRKLHSNAKVLIELAQQEFGGDPDVTTAVNAVHALEYQAMPEEIASTALCLASDTLSFVIGSAMRIEGGNSIRKL